jgi:hypothetical protein
MSLKTGNGMKVGEETLLSLKKCFRIAPLPHVFAEIIPAVAITPR